MLSIAKKIVITKYSIDDMYTVKCNKNSGKDDLQRLSDQYQTIVK